MKRLLLRWGGLAGVALAGAAWAAGAGSAPRILGKFKPKVGAWAEYEYVNKDGDHVTGKGRMKVAVVGKEGEDFWVESTFRRVDPKPKKGQEGGAMKMLFGKDSAMPKKAYMKTEAGLFDMTATMQSREAENPSGELKELGKEKVTVPAGSFDAQKYLQQVRKVKVTIWAVEGTGPYGMVRQVVEGPDGTVTMTLLKHGKGAKPEITGSPAASPMGAGEGPMMPGLQEMMKKAMERKGRKGRAGAEAGPGE